MWEPPAARADIKAGVPSYAQGSGGGKRAWIDMVWMTVSWEAYKIDTRLHMIDHHRRLGYREPKKLQKRE